MDNRLSAKCPCRFCPRRSVNCHSACDDYLDWKKEVDSAKITDLKKQQVFEYYHAKWKR